MLPLMTLVLILQQVVEIIRQRARVRLHRLHLVVKSCTTNRRRFSGGDDGGKVVLSIQLSITILIILQRIRSMYSFRLTMFRREF